MYALMRFEESRYLSSFILLICVYITKRIGFVEWLNQVYYKVG